MYSKSSKTSKTSKTSHASSKKVSHSSSSGKRGFAAMDPAKQKKIASKGGKASHGGGRPSSK